MAVPEETFTTLETEVAEVVGILLEALPEEGGEDAAVAEGIRRYARQVERIGSAAGAAGFIGLQDACTLLHENLLALIAQGRDLTAQERELLEEWPALVIGYMEGPADAQAEEELIRHLASPVWSRPLPEQEAAVLRSVLAVQPAELPAFALEAAEEEPAAWMPEVVAAEPVLEKTVLERTVEPEAEEAPPEPAVGATQPAAEEPPWAGAPVQERAVAEEVVAEQEKVWSGAASIPVEAEETPPAEQAALPGEEALSEADLETLAVAGAGIGAEESLPLEEPPAAPVEEELSEQELRVLEVAAHAVAEPQPPETEEAALEGMQEGPPPVEETPSAAEAVPAAPALSEAAQELVEILCMEVMQMGESAGEIIAIAVSEEHPADARSEALTDYAEQMERLAEASEAIGLTGLQRVCVQIQANLTRLAAQAQTVTDDQRQVLEGWPEQVLAYLRTLHDRAICESLAGYLGDPRWPDPLPEEEAAALVERLLSADLHIVESEGEARPTQAQPQDVSLELPEDVNPELLDSLVQELPQQTAEFSAAIQRLTEGEGTLQDVDVAQRIAHTLKGAGNTVGVRGIATLTHHLEDILLAFSKHAVLPGRTLAEVLMNAADCLETMSEALVGMSAPPPQALEVLQEVLDWANRIDREGIPAGQEGPRPAAPRPATAEAEAVAAPAQVPMLRVPAPLVDDLLRLVGESIILTGQIQERVRKTIQHTRSVQAQNRLFQQLISDLERLVDIQNVSSPLARFAQRGEFDPLELEQYNELNTVTHRLVEAAVDSQEVGHNVEENLAMLDTLLIDQGRLHRDSQEAVLRTRMVPVKTVVPRLQRSVRQTCRLTDKEAELAVKGADTLMDSNVLGEMVDPLMHILRNAVDHGLEHPELRQALGKDPIGQIELSFAREGNTIVVRCQDDGAGLDLEAIRRTAQRKGLLSPDKTMEEEDLSRLILLPGFSTRTETTQTSGRGIGLDMVYSRLLDIKGSLQIQSKTGKGCLLEMRLPVTLISTHALLVRARKHLYAISERGVTQLLYSGIGEIHRLGNTLTYQMGDEIYELTTLAELLNLPEDRRARVRTVPPVILAQDDTGATRAVLVEEILDSRDLVVKPLGWYIPKLAGVVGATILGDGSVVPVLDLPELLRVPLPKLVAAAAAGPETAPEAAESRRRIALVVDDSLSARRSLAQFVEDAGFEVRTARDGLEAIGIINAKRPDILLVDMEMPRMNGLELTAHVRANEATRGLPVIMITSRSTEKHRREAEAVGVNVYMTKPFAEEDLLRHLGTALG